MTIPDLLAATKYRVLVSAIYGAGESVAVSATGRTGELAPRSQIQHTPARPRTLAAWTCGPCDSQMYPALQSLARDPLVQD